MLAVAEVCREQRKWPKKYLKLQVTNQRALITEVDLCLSRKYKGKLQLLAKNMLVAITIFAIHLTKVTTCKI
jgi:hypothetical protein